MQKNLRILTNEFSKLENRAEVEGFLSGLLTPGEIQEFSRRIEIIKMLKKQMPQHEIARELKVGVATVTRGAKELQKGRFATL